MCGKKDSEGTEYEGQLCLGDDAAPAGSWALSKCLCQNIERLQGVAHV